jgi:hypothetical protein
MHNQDVEEASTTSEIMDLYTLVLDSHNESLGLVFEESNACNGKTGL